MKNLPFLAAVAIAAYFLFRKKPKAETQYVAPTLPDAPYVAPVAPAAPAPKAVTQRKTEKAAPPVIVYEDPVERQSAQLQIIGSCDLDGKPGTLVINEWGEEECIDL